MNFVFGGFIKDFGDIVFDNKVWILKSFDIDFGCSFNFLIIFIFFRWWGLVVLSLGLNILVEVVKSWYWVGGWIEIGGELVEVG